MEYKFGCLFGWLVVFYFVFVFCLFLLCFAFSHLSEVEGLGALALYQYVELYIIHRHTKF